MKEIKVGSNEAGQRFDKLLVKVLGNATKGFIYKMLRKKHIFPIVSDKSDLENNPAPVLPVHR